MAENIIRIDLNPEVVQAFREMIRSEISQAVENLRQKPVCYSKSDTAKLLNISIPTLNKLIQEGEIYQKKIEKRVLIPEAEIRDFISRHRPRSSRSQTCKIQENNREKNI